MQQLSTIPPLQFSNVRFVLTDMDETLTYQGRLQASTYVALEQLQGDGVRVIPVTAAPAGWCDQMARMWPVDGVIAENGGLFLRRSSDGRTVKRTYWQSQDRIAHIQERLQEIAVMVEEAIPSARLADDQAFRLTSLAYKRTAPVYLADYATDARPRAGDYRWRH